MKIPAWKNTWLSQKGLCRSGQYCFKIGGTCHPPPPPPPSPHYPWFASMSLIFFISTVRAPVFGRHQFFGTSEHYGKAHGSYYLNEWTIITLHVTGFLHPAIFNTSIRVLTNQVWKLLIALFKVLNTGAFTVWHYLLIGYQLWSKNKWERMWKVNSFKSEPAV